MRTTQLDKALSPQQLCEIVTIDKSIGGDVIVEKPIFNDFYRVSIWIDNDRPIIDRGAQVFCVLKHRLG